MEKHIGIGEQLNKAYEAYRQACMDRDNVKKKLAVCEQESRAQRKQIAQLQGVVAQMTAQLAASFDSSKGGIHGPPQSPRLENSEVQRKDGASNFSYEQLQDQLKASMQREYHYKEQLEHERLKLKKIEEEHKKCAPLLIDKSEEIGLLKDLVKNLSEKNEKQNYRPVPAYEMEVRSKRTMQEIPAAVQSADDKIRQGAEQVFCEIKKEFNQICKLTREQRIYLNTFMTKKENTAVAPVQFSMPIQCTDEANEEAQGITPPKHTPTKSTRASFTSITPRGLGADDEVSVSVESLSTLSVKFPPTDNDSEFLQSTSEKLSVLNPASAANAHANRPQAGSPLLPKNLSTSQCSPPESPLSAGTICNLENIKTPEREKNYGNSFFPAGDDNSLPLAANSPARKYKNTFCNEETPEDVESTGRTVRGPQQDIWKPFQHPENNPLPQDSEKWDLDSTEVCEFCQAVFPPSIRSVENFLRHLNSHFHCQS
ncbi:TRAF family member-associated NF-kappa-B activator isoform 1-T2 [Discoglossus pictus]